MANPCTLNTFKTVFSNNLPPEQAVPNPILQVLQIKQLAAQPGTPERYRIVLSDSNNFIQAMLAVQANGLVQNGDLTKGCFVQLKQYQANKVKGRKILIVIDLQVMKHLGTKEKIGNPTSMEDGPGDAAPQQQQQQQQQQAPQHQAASASNFYGNPPPQAAPQRQPAQQQQRRAPATETEANVYPIVAISPYQSKWTIKARVTYKSDIKHWSNQKSEGKLFTVHFLDESGEIRATGFNQECDKFYEVLQEGQVYYVSGCRVNFAKKQFSNIDNDYELTLGRETDIKPCPDDGVPQLKFNFVPLAELDKVDKDGIVDVIGVVKAVGDMDEITSKTTQKSFQKRDVTIVDSSNAQVRVTVWGKVAGTWEYPENTVVAFKGVKVSDFNGRSLSALFTSTITPAPDVQEAHDLSGWWQANGDRDLSSFTSHNTMGVATGRSDPVKTIQEAKDENLGMGEKPDYFQLKAMIVYIKRENLSYPACVKEGCNKKAIQVDDVWHCEKCQENFPRPNYRYVLSVSVEDAFGQTWLSCFDDVGRLIMGKSADDLQQLKERSENEGDMEAKKELDNTFTNAMCQTYMFKVKAKMDTYMETQRVRYQVMSAHPLNYASEAQKLAELIKQYSI